MVIKKSGKVLWSILEKLREYLEKNYSEYPNAFEVTMPQGYPPNILNPPYMVTTFYVVPHQIRRSIIRALVDSKRVCPDMCPELESDIDKAILETGKFKFIKYDN